MTIEELPQPYRHLARQRRKKDWLDFKNEDNINRHGREYAKDKFRSVDSFYWGDTLEGHYFWEEAHMAVHNAELIGYYKGIESDWLAIKNKI